MRSIRLFDLLMGFSRALDLVTPVLAGHHLRVTYLSQMLAEKLDLSKRLRKHMLMASMLHDIGAIPLKSDTRDLIFERNKAQHCRAGWAFCKTAGLPRPVCDMVLLHHTEWSSAESADETALPANCIHLADRLEIALRANPSHPLKYISAEFQNRTEEFSPACLGALEQMAEEAELAVCPHQPQDMADSLAAIFGDEILGPRQMRVLCGLFSQIIDSKSPFTATHSCGVAHTARILLQLTNFADAKDLSTMFIAGLLHDIGKLAVPLEILEKPSSLTDAEFREIQRHAEVSLDLLGSIPGFTCVRDWGGWHHERINGQGYPHHRRDSALTIPMRIMAVADVFTALTEDRPYRMGMPIAQAMDVMRDMVEKQNLDADIVALLAEHAARVNKARIRAQRTAAANFVAMRNLCRTAGCASPRKS